MFQCMSRKNMQITLKLFKHNYDVETNNSIQLKAKL